MCGIYKIINKINGKIYIGQSIDIERRIKTHIQHGKYNYASYNSYLYRDMYIYGIDNFEFEVVEECKKEELNEKEIYYIKYFDSKNNGYNISDGGGGALNVAFKLSENDIMDIYKLLIETSLTETEIADMFNTTNDTISKINLGKTRYHDGYKYPIRKYKLEKQNIYCIDCGKEIKYGKRCKDCYHFNSRKVERPNKEELLKLIHKYPFTYIASIYKVSDNTIRKWCKYYNLPYKKCDLKNT